MKSKMLLLLLVSGHLVAQTVPSAERKLPLKTFIILHSTVYVAGMTDSSMAAYGHDCCKGWETNPIAPQGATLRSLEVTASWGAISWVDYRLMKHGHTRLWWIAPVVGTAIHSYEIYRWKQYIDGYHPIQTLVFQK